MFRTWRALRFLFTGPFILLFLVIINAVTTPGHWWVKWAALGIGIAWVLSLLRVARAVLLLGGMAALMAYLSRNWRPFGPRQDAPYRDPRDQI
jgi:hypothetical protein